MCSFDDYLYMCVFIYWYPPSSGFALPLHGCGPRGRRGDDRLYPRQDFTLSSFAHWELEMEIDVGTKFSCNKMYVFYSFSLYISSWVPCGGSL